MVNSLILVRPNVPLARDLKKWSNRQENLISQLTQVRYGTPKPIKGITVRMSLQGQDNSDKSSVRSRRSQSSRKSRKKS